MASIFGHGIVGYTITKVIDNKRAKSLLLMAIFSAILPDLDVVAFYFGIPYSHPFGHRGFTHSILFALLWSFILMFTLGRQKKLLWFLVVFLSTISHGVLDAMTTGGKGIGFFIPFNNERFFFSLRVIKVSPLGIERFFSKWGLQVIISEIKYILLPCFLVFIVRFLIRRLKDTDYNEI